MDEYTYTLRGYSLHLYKFKNQFYIIYISIYICHINMIYFEILRTQRVSPRGIHIFIIKKLIFHQSVPLKVSQVSLKKRPIISFIFIPLIIMVFQCLIFSKQKRYLESFLEKPVRRNKSQNFVLSSSLKYLLN